MLIAGAGVAGLETLLALRGLAGGRVEVTILAPELKFVSRGMSVVAQPFNPQHGRGVRIEDIAIDLGGRQSNSPDAGSLPTAQVRSATPLISCLTTARRSPSEQSSNGWHRARPAARP